MGEYLHLKINFCNVQSLEDAWHDDLCPETGYLLETQCLLKGTNYDVVRKELGYASEYRIFDTEMYADCEDLR